LGPEDPSPFGIGSGNVFRVMLPDVNAFPFCEVPGVDPKADATVETS